MCARLLHHRTCIAVCNYPRGVGFECVKIFLLKPLPMCSVKSVHKTGIVKFNV